MTLADALAQAILNANPALSAVDSPSRLARSDARTMANAVIDFLRSYLASPGMVETAARAMLRLHTMTDSNVEWHVRENTMAWRQACDEVRAALSSVLEGVEGKA